MRLQSEDEHLVAFFARLFPNPQKLPLTVWHYTSAEGLIGILRTGHLFATHVACLNDETEHRYLASMLEKEARRRAAAETEPPAKALYESAVAALSTRDTTGASAFATCFTTKRDDLGQWRGYGGGECTFAVEFRTEDLAAFVKKRWDRRLIRMRYDEAEHQRLVAAVLDHHIELWRRFETLPDAAKPGWFETYLDPYQDVVELAHACVKHPKFDSEAEYRLFTTLQDGEHEKLEFRAKRTLLSRHLPLDLRDENERLPIVSVMVGPGGRQSVSKIAVGDLLKKHRYPELPVHLSEVPYRYV